MPADTSLSLPVSSPSSTTNSELDDAFDSEIVHEDPHQFYRQYNPPASGLPDIYVDRSVGAMATSKISTVTSKRKSLAPTNTGHSRPPQPFNRPDAISMRSSSAPVKNVTLSPTRQKSNSPTIVAATSTHRGSVRDIANHFNQSASSAGPSGNSKTISNGLRKISTTSLSRTPSARDSKIVTPNSRKHQDKARVDSQDGQPTQRNSATTSPLRSSRKPWSNTPRIATDLPLKTVNDMLREQDGDWKPLFGEIIYQSDGPSAKENKIQSHRRGGSENQMQTSTSNIDSQLARLNLEPSPLHDHNPFDAPSQRLITSTQKHKRSQSDLPRSVASSEPNHALSKRLDSPISPTKSPLSPSNKVKGSPSSKIPVSTRRHSATRPESITLQSPSRSRQSRIPSSPSRTGRLQPTIYTAKDPYTHPPATPPSRRYDPRAERSPSNEQCLAAFISAPLPKKSPPLRSSRPRQHVTLSPNNSPQTDVFDRSVVAVQPNADPSNSPFRHDEHRNLLNKNHSGLNHLILLERKSSIIQAMNSSDRHLTHSRSVPINPEKNDNEKSATAQDQLPFNENTATVFNMQEISKESPILKLDVTNLPENDLKEPLTRATNIETYIESPMLGSLSESKTTLLPDASFIRSSSATLSQSATTTDPSETDISDHGKDPELTLQQQTKSGSMLDHILQMRSDNLSTVSQTEFGNESRERNSDLVDIVLERTPTAQAGEERWPASGGHGSNRSRNQNLWSDDSLSSPESCSDFNRSGISNIGERDSDDGRRDSIFPDDSISVRHKSEAIPSVPVFKDHLNLPPLQTTLDGEAHSTVNRVLEQYYSTNHVTPEKAYQFQQQINDISPVLGQFDGWNSKGATQRYLERLIKESLGVKDDELSNGSFHYNRIDEPSPVNGENSANLEDFYTGGTAVVYEGEGRHGLYASEDSERRAMRPKPPPKDHSSSQRAPPGNSYKSLTSNTDRAIGNEAMNYSRGLAIDGPNSVSKSMNPHPPAPVLSHHQPPPPPFNPRIPPPPPLPPSTSPSLYVDNPPSSIFPAAMPEGANSRARSYANIIQRPQTDRSYTSIETHLTRPRVQVRGPTSLSEAEATSRNELTASSDTDQKRLRQRWNLIKELIDTEFSFSSDMHVVENIYKGTSLSCKDIDEDDKRVLFGNSEQIVALSEELYSILKHAAAAVYTPARTSRWNVNRSSLSESGSGANDQPNEGSDLINDEDDRKTFIGQAFSGHTSKIEHVYGEYLRNHEFANQRLAKLQAMPNVEIWLKECGEQIQDITKAWSLDSLLVKPVQRLLKYPLLLKQLIDNTPQDHPDCGPLNTALNDITEASYRMNDYKKRGDLVDTFLSRKRKDSEPKFHLSKFLRAEKLGKAGFTPTASYDDPLFNELVESWGDNYMGLQIIMRDYRFHGQELQRMLEQFIQYIGAMETFLDVGQTGHYEIESTWRKFALAIREIAATALTEHKRLIRQKIIDKFTVLLHELDNYFKLIEKRKKRVGDYARYRILKERGDKVDKKVQEGAEQYTSLNETLKKAIPQLYKLCGKFCMATLRQFISLEVKWQKAWEIKLRAVLDEPEMPKDFTAIVESFMSDFSYRESQVLQLGLCNGSVLADIANFVPLSTLPGSSDDGSVSQRRSSSIQTGQRTTSVNSDTPLIPTPDTSRRQSGSRLLSPLGETVSSLPSPTAGRIRASSALSNRGPLTPTSLPRPGHVPPRPSTSTDQSLERYQYQSQASLARNGHGDSAAAIAAAAQLSAQAAEAQRRSESLNSSGHSSSHNYEYQQQQQQQQQSSLTELEASTTPLVRFSGIFSSAMPMPDSPLVVEEQLPDQTSIEHFLRSEPKVLYVAVSLHQFKFDGTKTEAGFPYLGYVKGEIFDVVAEKGEIWLARNQDDPNQTIGWIWYRHFRPLY